MRWIRLNLWLGLLVLACQACDASDAPPAKKLAELSAQSRQLEARLAQIQGALAHAEPGPCPESPIRTAIQQSQSRSVLFLDEKSLGLAAAGKALDPKLPLWKYVSEVLVKRRPSSAITDQKSATDAAFDAMTLQKEHDFVAVLKFEFTPPRAEEKGFHGGELQGRLGLFALKDARLLCTSEVFAHSTEAALGKPGQSPQEAADKDFELQLRRALEGTFASMTRELNLDLR